MTTNIRLKEKSFYKVPSPEFEKTSFERQVGSIYLKDNIVRFDVWAPHNVKVDVHIFSPNERILPLKKDDFGYFSGVFENIAPGTKYLYKLNEGEFPDPASNFQSEGVHGPSQVTDHSRYIWNDNEWHVPALKEWIIYEMHVGTFTNEGTFKSVISQLPYLKSLGINAIEIMPVSQFPGNRNWGYDGVFIYAVQNSYGTPDDFKQLINQCHINGISVILDVVYNHLGPEGNYLSMFAPYFTDKYKLPWGDAINFDGEYCDGVRNYYMQNILFWFKNYHIDGLRMDAIHAIIDTSAVHFWEYAHEWVRKTEKSLNRKLFLFAECDYNSPKPVLTAEKGGWNFDALWLDDFHHALYSLTDKKGKTYYADFGTLDQMKKAIKEGFVYSGEYVEFRKRRFGKSSSEISGDKFVCFSQNHDMIGNRMLGERDTVLMDFETLKLSAAVFLLAPYIPMLFMGQEYAEDNPFLYFVSHKDKNLIEKVKEGRKGSFKRFNFDGEPPDPSSESTFLASKLNKEKINNEKNSLMLSWYKDLIKLRKEIKVFKNFDKENIDVEIIDKKILFVTRKDDGEKVYIYYNFSDVENEISIEKDLKIIIDSLDYTPTHIKNMKRDKNRLFPWNVKVFISEIKS